MRLRELKESGTDGIPGDRKRCVIWHDPVKDRKGKLCSDRVTDGGLARAVCYWSLDSDRRESANGQIPRGAPRLHALVRVPHRRHVRAAAIRSLTQPWPIDDVYGADGGFACACAGIPVAGHGAFVSMLGMRSVRKTLPDGSTRTCAFDVCNRLPENVASGRGAKDFYKSAGRPRLRRILILPKMIWFGLMNCVRRRIRVR